MSETLMTVSQVLDKLRDNCIQERQQINVFLLSILCSFISALVIAIVFEGILKYLRSKKNQNFESLNNLKSMKWKSYAQHLMSDRSTNSAKFFELSVLIMTSVSFLIFLIHSNLRIEFKYSSPETCQPFWERFISILDLISNLFFLFYFTVRLILARNKLWFLFEIYSLVDFMTIPPSFVAIFLDRTWIGFMFCRAVMLWRLPDLLIKFNRLETNFALTFIRLITGFAILVLISSGFIFLFENSGDPFEYLNAHTVGYKDSVYYIIFLVSTIGNYQSFVSTEYGRGFNAVLIILLLISLLWFLAQIFHSNRIINTVYYKSFSFKSQKFIIISGHLSKNSLETIFDGFNSKKEKFNIEIVLMDTKFSELNENWRFKQKRVKYFCGSVLNQKDLKRLQADKAERCILLAQKHSKDIDSEDATNIMSVMSVKTYCKQIPITVQLNRSQNKYYLNRIPEWNTNKGDKVLCVSELRLRTIGQSCLAPGLNTLLYNLVCHESHKPSKSNCEVQRDYIKGTKMQIFVKNLSPSFEEMTFSQTSELCFTKFGIILFAIQTNQEIVINPKPDFKLPKLTRAYFIAQDKQMVKCALWYCLNCHSDVTDVKLIDKCKCLRHCVPHLLLNSIFFTFSVEDIVKQKHIHDMGFDTEEDKSEEINLLHLTSHPIEKSQDLRDCDSKSTQKKTKDKNKAKKDKKAKKRKDSTSSSSSSDGPLESDKQITHEFTSDCNYDSSASFHYCPQRSIDDCILKRDSQLLNGLTDHVIIAVLAERDSPLIELKNLVLTLRTSNIASNELKAVLIVANIDFIRREWSELENIPEVYVFNGSVLCRDHLNDINLIVCNICVILSANNIDEIYSELSDKSSILANINVKTFTFDDSKLQLLTLRMKDSTSLSVEERPPLKLQRKGSVYCVNIPVITEVQNKDNIRKLFVESRGDNQNMNIIESQWFRSGSVFINAFIDSLTALSYFKPEIIKLIETLVSGGLTTKSENILCQTQCLKWKALNTEAFSNRDRCRVTQIALRGPLNVYKEAKYGQLFTEALNSYGILCFGIYRLLEDSDSNSGPDIRYVITNPFHDFQLNPNDLIFAFIQFETKLESNETQN